MWIQCEDGTMLNADDLTTIFAGPHPETGKPAVIAKHKQLRRRLGDREADVEGHHVVATGNSDGEQKEILQKISRAMQDGDRIVTS